MNQYKLTLKHDNGKINIIVIARNEQSAIDMVCRAEHCPESSITKVKFIKTICDWSV